jgi:hypothetical protein
MRTLMTNIEIKIEKMRIRIRQYENKIALLRLKIEELNKIQ